MEEQFKTLIVLSHYLEVFLLWSYLFDLHACVEWNTKNLLPPQTGRFRQFWDEAAKNRHIVEAVPGMSELRFFSYWGYSLRLWHVGMCYCCLHWLTTELIVGFEQAIQAYAVHVLSLTYQKVPRSVLAEVCFNFLVFTCSLRCSSIWCHSYCQIWFWVPASTSWHLLFAQLKNKNIDLSSISFTF